MLDWIGISTRVFGPITQRLFRRWLFDAELLEAFRVVYTYERSDAPMVDLYVSVRVHNRNSSPTTVYADRVEVTLKTDTDKGFGRPTVAPRHRFSSDKELARYDMSGSSSVELTFSARQYYATLPEEYVKDSPIEVTLELAETFGNHRKLRGPASLRNLVKQ